MNSRVVGFDYRQLFRGISKHRPLFVGLQPQTKWIHSPAVWREITIILNGERLTGTYSCSDWMVTVRSQHGNKSTQLDGSSPLDLARLMLRELAQAHGDAGRG
jgi:hypothetical protein